MSSNDYREMYVSEALEHVETMNQALLKLEKNPNTREHIDLVFRSAHTIKGMSATMGYEQTRELCKNIENEFDKFRKGDTKPTPNIISAIFKCIDLLQKIIQDETFVVDLDPYVQLLQHPDKIIDLKIEDTSVQNTQSPTIRVRMDDLDTLVNHVGELVISKMSLEQIVRNNATDEIRQTVMTLDRLITDLHYHSMKIRLVPIDQIFSRFPRVVRDIATQQKKEIQFDMDGGGLELDRTVLDSINDPLLHMLRNAVDHGIETPEERKAAGKPEKGTIKLSAYRIGDKVAVRLDDNGKGLNLNAVKRKAIEKNIITEEIAKTMNDDEVIALLGTPGLSTAKTVTDVSGRGVGMDVVISQIESVGGNVKIETISGKGTSITLTIPLSLSIIGGLLVNISNQKFVLPLSSIKETISVVKNDVQIIHGSEVIILREQVIPLVYIARVLNLCDNNSERLTIVIVEKNNKHYGLVVDSFDRKQEIVIKSLDETFQSSSFTNATILPDGKVALILDPNTIL